MILKLVWLIISPCNGHRVCLPADAIISAAPALNQPLDVQSYSYCQ